MYQLAAFAEHLMEQLLTYLRTREVRGRMAVTHNKVKRIFKDFLSVMLVIYETIKQVSLQESCNRIRFNRRKYRIKVKVLQQFIINLRQRLPQA